MNDVKPLKVPGVRESRILCIYARVLLKTVIRREGFEYTKICMYDIIYVLPLYT